MARRKVPRLDDVDHDQHFARIAEKPEQFRLITEAQKRAWAVIEENTVVFLLGAPGSGKTQLATAYAQQAVAARKYKRVVHTRPVVEALESLGWLPGTVEDKLRPYMVPLETCTAKTRVGGNETITIPIAYMRGITLENCCAVLDESQNCSYAQLKLYLTRLGNNAKMIICGDTDQADIRDSGLAQVADDLKDLEGVGVYTFVPSDSVRHPMVEQMLGKLSK